MPDFLKALDNVGSMMGGSGDLRNVRNDQAVEQAARNLLLGGAEQRAGTGALDERFGHLGKYGAAVAGPYSNIQTQLLSTFNGSPWGYDEAGWYTDIPALEYAQTVAPLMANGWDINQPTGRDLYGQPLYRANDFVMPTYEEWAPKRQSAGNKSSNDGKKQVTEEELANMPSVRVRNNGNGFSARRGNQMEGRR
jgi:hypothetical protein